MIDTQRIVEFFSTSLSQPISEKNLLKRLRVKSDERHAVKRMLRELLASGELIDLKGNKFALPEHVNLVVGELHANPRGFAFVVPKARRGVADVYIGPDETNGAFHGDTVIARIRRKKGGKLLEGQIVRILQRGRSRLVGLYEDHGDYGFVIPEDSKLSYKVYVRQEDALNARHEQIVVVQILHYDERGRNPEGQIVEILGYAETPGMDEKMVMHDFGLPARFPSYVLDAVEHISAAIPQEELERRLDLRDACIVTIDGENARDFDDAVSIERLENGNYTLGVHIADVNYYVQPDSVLDQEAFQRGTSVYFPDRAIPMFPERLSSDLCCLRPEEDRLTISVLMEFDPTAKLVRYDITESVIHSKARLTYTIVRQILKEQDEELRQQYAVCVPSLELMKDLSEVLLQQRMQRGSLDFDLPEPEILLDIQGQVENIIKAERNLAHRLIEEFMIAANETVASHLTWMQIPMIYRVHESPDDSKVAELNTFLGTLGLHLQKGPQIHAKDMQKLIKLVRGKPVEHLVNYVTLRAMKQAHYTAKHAGHFGLASKCYTHFTSPIRRYPDLIVHRVLKDTLRGKGFSEEALEKRREYLETIAEHSSLRERVATDAEREIVLIKKLRFMRERIGDVFEGVISGVAAFGLFIELREYFVEGLVHITQLHDDRYFYREENFSLEGQQFHKTYRVGDPVKVQLAHVNMTKRQIDFHLL